MGPMPYLAYQQRKDSRKIYVHIQKGIRERTRDGTSRVRTLYLGYLGELHAPDFRKKLKAAERKYGPLNLKRRSRRKRK